MQKITLQSGVQQPQLDELCSPGQVQLITLSSPGYSEEGIILFFLPQTFCAEESGI
jgi:hypothetical protein